MWEVNLVIEASVKRHRTRFLEEASHAHRTIVHFAQAWAGKLRPFDEFSQACEDAWSGKTADPAPQTPQQQIERLNRLMAADRRRAIKDADIEARRKEREEKRGGRNVSAKLAKAMRKNPDGR